MPFSIARAEVPAGVATDDFILRPIAVEDAERDYAAVMASREHLRTWEQSSWPADDFTVEENRADVEMLAQRHARGDAFTYTVTDVQGAECLGCVYLMSTTAGMYAGARITPHTDVRWSDYEAAVYFWVRSRLLGTEVDRTLLQTLRAWLDDAWSLDGHLIVTNAAYVPQFDLFETSDLVRRFTVEERGKTSPYIAYA